MNKQNGIIKLCVLMAFMSYCIWSQHEKQTSGYEIDNHITSIIHQVKTINQSVKNQMIKTTSSSFSQFFEGADEIILINDEAMNLNRIF